MWNDLRFALRQLRKNASFTLVAALTLALGIGAATAIFSVIYGVLLKPYPYAHPEGIWVPGLHGVKAQQIMRPYRLDTYFDMTKLPCFSSVMATAPGNALLTGEFAPEAVRAIRVTGNAFAFIGVPPLLGRTIGISDIRPNGEPEAVTLLSYKRWQKLFGGDTNALGKTLRLDDQLYTIVGVMPPHFGWWTDDGVWLPMTMNSSLGRSVFPIVRLASGISTSAARDQWQTLLSDAAKANPNDFPNEALTATLTNYLDLTVAKGEMEKSLKLLFGAVGFLLLIACANVANLQLARAASRSREMAIRLSIGAGRGQLIRQLLTESVLISLAGGLLGLLFAYWITSAAVTLMPGNLVPAESKIEVNTYVLTFCFAVSTATGILFGLAPAIQLSRPNLTDSLKDESRGSSAAAGGKLRATLVMVEVALSVVLLVSAGLTVRSFFTLQQLDLGFLPERAIVIGLPLPPKKYATYEQRIRFTREILKRAKNLPGVEAATAGFGGLPFGGQESAFTREGAAQPESHSLILAGVGADYLRALGIPLKRGQMLSEHDVDAGDAKVVINEAAARLWPVGEDPVGGRIRIDALQSPDSPRFLTPTNLPPYLMIIGVIGNTRNDEIRNDPQPAAFFPYTLLATIQPSLAVRSRADPRPLLGAIRAQVAEMDREQPILSRTIEEMVEFQTAQPRFTMMLFGFFAALGLALAMAGIYSVLSYLVSTRTREIGVRMALGAQRSDVLGLILGTGGRLVGIGLAAGIIASFGAARLLGSQIELFRVSALDPVAYLAVVVLLGLVALAACLIPARRATKVDPILALRAE